MEWFATPNPSAYAAGMRWLWAPGFLGLMMASCSSSTTNENGGGASGASSGGASSGGTSSGGASSGGASSGGASSGGGSGGAGGAGGSSVDAGTCHQKADLLCVECCRTTDQAGYAAFVEKLKNYVCGNSPCQGSCPGVCSSGDVNGACAKCILAKTSGPSVVDEVQANCTSYGPAACASWADCVLSCL